MKGRISARRPWLMLYTFLVLAGTVLPAAAQNRKPNIVVIFGDDIGVWNVSAYHRGMMGGRTPNIDKLAQQGAMFTDYYSQNSCTAGRAAFITGQTPLRRSAEGRAAGSQAGSSRQGPDDC
jgi:Sulfatase